ncbi:H/ACA ribonucleoprotein complex subunit 2-like protein [Tribolium castaneum]|uniref:H/ACA ribonucleoprotein complex subunit 2 n=1 Tax=Tribolium castaneum TaxID=7070 RepID=D6X2E6_TRICA|nr:PREDICTED: H/ACA ribonucleoprotein complex subunit 2-like protein [Tribolium castaneum]XP_972497.1 PREDICTED: H/ACA ribonucleoprotein complex subunit 2-like protein [Tribolium castaneum]EFA09871.1 H/ACA ribonucleoprotein complex subunit 2-like protein [Tribolium castaneum]|eukprot:XP_015838706.1 PREDICTED: H/ACA ribonucleoprotein complex subunit 2-like protein [Tribolium castaneum]
MGEIKTEPLDGAEDQKEEELTYEQKVNNCNTIAKPMASKKLTKKVHKLVKKAVKHKTYVRNGLKDVQKRIRKGETGIVIFAGDITPIDIMCHLPAVCEDRDIPYVYVPSRRDLGGAMGIMRGCMLALVRPHDDYKDMFNELKDEIKTLAVEL